MVDTRRNILSNEDIYNRKIHTYILRYTSIYSMLPARFIYIYILLNFTPITYV